MWRLLFLLLLLPSALGATLQGTIYTEELTLASNVLLEIDTTPTQRMLSQDGSYSFDLPTGMYTLTATTIYEGRNLSTTESINVQGEGIFTYDLFLFLNLEEDDALYQEIAADLDESPTIPTPDESTISWPSVLLFLIFLALLFIFLKKFYPLDAEETTLDGELQHIVDIIRGEGGRISQRELRKHLPESEAKISLLLTELEEKGLLQKIKKGRGNILILKK